MEQDIGLEAVRLEQRADELRYDAAAYEAAEAAHLRAAEAMSEPEAASWYRTNAAYCARRVEALRKA